jgi:hypothetical protein
VGGSLPISPATSRDHRALAFGDGRPAGELAAARYRGGPVMLAAKPPHSDAIRRNSARWRT